MAAGWDLGMIWPVEGGLGYGDDIFPVVQRQHNNSLVLLNIMSISIY